MRGFLVRALITAFGLWLAASIIPGMRITGTSTVLLAALLLVIVNAIIRPLVVLLTFPVTIVTLGFFLLVINAGMLALVAAMLEGFTVGGFFSALFGAIIVSLISSLGSWYIGPHGRYEILVVRRRQL